ncbi:conserved hypothetical protein [Hyphomicrobiales bacterium]|nr:conserved hypothetical protein [Hyphomicrobiales bacterium]CAH1697860.1 conserved hypothetical protein [Hyphomicrobiales bacterium]CAI0347506.1 conserved hypothetical protein [Hyphomicrobiales bacterium]
MAGNRFEQVDEPQADAITLSLTQRGDEALGRVLCPADLAAGHLVNDFVSDELAAKEAFRTAVHLANEIRAPVVVVDPEGVWQDAWGMLYREE